MAGFFPYHNPHFCCIALPVPHCPTLILPTPLFPLSAFGLVFPDQGYGEPVWLNSHLQQDDTCIACNTCLSSDLVIVDMTFWWLDWQT